MNKKKILIATIIILVLSFIFHSVYDKIPSVFTSLFFPVNESIWEHNKMILLSFLVLSLIERFLFKGNISILQYFIAAILCMFILNSLFTPIYLYILNKKENMFIVIFLYIIFIIASLLITGKLHKYENRSNDIIGITAFAFVALLFMILTYNPLKLPIFYDYSGGFYGIKAK